MFHSDHIELTEYARQAQYDFFSTYQNPFYGVTLDLDITGVRAFASSGGHSLYVLLGYLFTRSAVQTPAFRVRKQGSVLVEYSELHNRMIIPTQSDTTGSYTIVRLPFDADLALYLSRAADLIASAKTAVDLSEEGLHRNFVYYSALPGIAFTSLTHLPENDRFDASPKISFGKFREQDGKVIVPVSIQVNHIFIDGMHLSALVQQAEKFCSEF